jgi:hypothetical protein
MQGCKPLVLWSVLVSIFVLYPVKVCAMSPLKVFEKNPRYFTNGDEKAVYLTGSHTWTNFIDAGDKDPPAKFDYQGYLEFLQRHHHNFFRLWNWEQAKWAVHTKHDFFFDPSPYSRPGPGTALDGKPKFDLAQFNEEYFKRMRQRVIQASDRGIYVSVMLFNGFSVECKELEEVENYFGRVKRVLRGWWNKENKCRKNGNPWRGHPFNRENNVNGIDGDLDVDGEGKEVHTLKIPAITTIQERYVRKVIDTLNDLPNVLWEISNESHTDSIEWQYHMIDFIKKYESEKPYQHPVGMTVAWPGGKNSDLFQSPADWISPNDQGLDSYKENPPVASGEKVILTDTDHLWGVGGDYKWVWRSFLRGLNPIFMDPYTDTLLEYDLPRRDQELIRKNMGYTSAYANKINLVAILPRPELASSMYCLALQWKEYLVYAEGGAVTVNLSQDGGEFSVKWLDPLTGQSSAGGTTVGNGSTLFTAPFGGDAILYLRKVN